MMSAFGPERTFLAAPHMSAFGGKADIAVFAYRDVDGEALVETDPAQVAHKARSRSHCYRTAPFYHLVHHSLLCIRIEERAIHEQKRVAAPLLRRHSAGQLHRFLWWCIIQSVTTGQSQSKNE